MAANKRKMWSRVGEKNQQDADEELLVFGYSCKLFRDDEKALYIEQGKHLIPWMGDDRLMIDRYDGRGYLHDLEHYEAKTSQDLHAGLSEEEIKVETLCDEERYYCLYKDIAEEEMYHEEEMKRLHMALAAEGAYNQVCFTYSEESNAKDSIDSTEPTEPSDTSEEQPFIPPSQLGLPEGMEVPPTIKMNQIIEKTANFVAQHGGQMEIVIKAKQAKNSQFSFMHFDHPLNPYYKHLILCIKNGKYKPSSDEKNSKNGGDEDDDDDDDDDDSHYLHPSLLANKVPTIIPKINYSRGQEDDYYSLLVKQLKGKVAKSMSNDAGNSTPNSGTQSPNDTDHSAVKTTLAPTDPSLPPPPGLEPVTLPPPPPPPPEIQSGVQVLVSSVGQVETKLSVAAPVVSVPEKQENKIKPPPPDVQPIIDKMACYVAKNGKDFESVVLNKGDKRFEFVYEWHELNPYYLFKKSLFEQQLMKEKRQHALEVAEEIARKKLKEKADQAAAVAAAAAAATAAALQPATVSFSIKSKDSDISALDKRNALHLGDESSESETGDIEKRDQTGIEESLKFYPVPAKLSTSDLKEAKIRNEILEARLAEEKLKDKLAAAAREKMSSASREKLLQMERKKRAALFLTMIKKDKNPSSVTKPIEDTPIVFGPQLPEGMTTTETGSVSSHGSRKSPSDRKRRSSRSRSRSPGYKRNRRSRSPSHRSYHRSRSRSLSRFKSYSKSKKARTPPAAYSVVRRSCSSSPHRHGSRYRSRSRSTERNYKRSSYRRSPTRRGRFDDHSRHRHRHSRSRSKSKSRSHRRRGSSNSRSRSRSRSQKREKSKSPSEGSKIKDDKERSSTPENLNEKSENRS